VSSRCVAFLSFCLSLEIASFCWETDATRHAAAALVVSRRAQSVRGSMRRQSAAASERPSRLTGALTVGWANTTLSCVPCSGVHVHVRVDVHVHVQCSSCCHVRASDVANTSFVMPIYVPVLDPHSHRTGHRTPATPHRHTAAAQIVYAAPLLTYCTAPASLCLTQEHKVLKVRICLHHVYLTTPPSHVIHHDWRTGGHAIVKGKGKGLDTCYSATYKSQTRE